MGITTTTIRWALFLPAAIAVFSLWVYVFFRVCVRLDFNGIYAFSFVNVIIGSVLYLLAGVKIAPNRTTGGIILQFVMLIFGVVVMVINVNDRDFVGAVRMLTLIVSVSVARLIIAPISKW
jgi:hypothetical protein